MAEGKRRGAGIEGDLCALFCVPGWGRRLGGGSRPGVLEWLLGAEGGQGLRDWKIRHGSGRGRSGVPFLRDWGAMTARPTHIGWPNS